MTIVGQRGQAIVLIALMLTVLTGMAAIAIDGARAYALRRDMQAAVDSAALAAADKLQQSGSYVSAEQAATANFASNLRLYGAPSCSPSYGSPGASPWTVACTFSDGTALTQVVRGLGPQGSQFTLTATRRLQLQFGRILTNGVNPTVAAASTGNVNNLLYTPALAALNQSGCGGAGGTAFNISGSGALNVNGDVVSNGTITVAVGTLRVAGDIYARCQVSVPGSVNACYASGASTPCSYPDTAGATRVGSKLVDPRFLGPTVSGGSVGIPGSNVVLSPGIYSALAVLNGGRCWFLSGGVYDFQLGLQNLGDFASNDLKPPDEPNAFDNTQRAAVQFWDTNSVNCSGSFELTKVTAAHDVPTGRWSIVVTSVRTDTYNGVSYPRESAPSMCQTINLNNHFDAIQLTVSNVPGATSYNIYAAPPGNGCAGPFGLADSLPVSVPVLNSNTNPCPLFTGNGCSLGHETILLDDQLVPPFAPNGAAAPGTTGAYPPDPELVPLAAGLPNQNPVRGAGTRGDRANENYCETLAAAYATCPAPITPGAVELYFPSGGCMTFGNGGDTYAFSGYQYNWMSVFEPGPASPPANTCANTLGAAGNTALIGLVYAPSASLSVTSTYTFEAAGVGGVLAASLSFIGTLPSITFSSSYALVPPASRLTA